MGNVKPEISKPMTVSLLSRNYTVDAYYTLKPGLYKDLNLVNVVCLTPGDDTLRRVLRDAVQHAGGKEISTLVPESAVETYKADVRRIALEEAVRHVPALNDTQRVAVFDLDPLESDGIVLGKAQPLIIHFFGAAAGAVIPEAAIHHTAVGTVGKKPDRPGPLDRVKHIGIFVHRLCLIVLPAAVQGEGGFCFQGLKIPLYHLIEVDKPAVSVVDNLDFRRLLSEKYRGSANKKFAV
jgi:hypothetical protein